LKYFRYPDSSSRKKGEAFTAMRTGVQSYWNSLAPAIGWDAVNIFFAPFLVGMGDRDVHQLAQMLVFEYSQQNVARGGQAIFSDINLYWEVPPALRRGRSHRARAAVHRQEVPRVPARGAEGPLLPLPVALAA
jgi:hypothetical protein